MAVVTRIDPSGRKGSRLVVHLDGERWTAMPRRWVAKRAIEPGRTIAGEEREAIEAELARRVGRFLCLVSLNRGARSRSELARRLDRYGLPPRVVEHTLAEVEGSGLVDDRALAASVAASLRRRGYGESRIRHALARRGLGEVELEPVDESDEQLVARALSALGRRHLDDHAKAMRFLARRGFTAGICRRAVADRACPAR